MQRPTNQPTRQMMLDLHLTPRHPLDPEIREALISALADLLLEACGAAPLTQVAGPGVGHES